jgi:farnesyl-diphosphate farnesyltransferase
MFLIPPKAVPDPEAKWKRSMAAGQIDDPQAFAAFLLEKTSRTFALNIQVLPAGLRRQVLLAYLFCRMADTLEDDADLAEGAKVRLLEAFRGLFPPGPTSEGRIAAFRSLLPPEWIASDRWDRLLVWHCHWILPQLQSFPAGAVEAISRCVDEMCVGMIDFTRRQAGVHDARSREASGREGQVLIGSVEELDRYCYYVAGTVGNLLCDLFTLHSPLIGGKRSRALRSLSVSFGLGLQLTNILKDVQEDRRRNVSYIPSDLLAEEGLDAAAFGAGGPASARVMARLLAKAQGHLRDALDYTCLLPRLEPRLRLFCLWPLFMAAENLVVMAEHPGGAPTEGKLKISRGQVKDIVGRTSLACWSNLWLRRMFRQAMSRLDSRLAATVGNPGPGAPNSPRPIPETASLTPDRKEAK